MSSSEFVQVMEGKTAKSAFRAAVKQALYEHGHNGYTGTIAEKDEEGFIMIVLPKGTKKTEQNGVDYANQLLHFCDDRISSKYAPAGCIEVRKGMYVFFGQAQT